jgi:Domain of unknown function (DUF3291)
VSGAQTGWQLAQVNVAEAVARLDEPEMAGFLELLGPLDELARRSPGFVWRPQAGEVSDAELAVFGDPMRMIANWSVWDSLDSFGRYVFGPQHRAAMRQRRRWFTPTAGPTMALWWVPAGERPGGAEGHRRLQLLRRHGPTPASFTLRQTYPNGTGWPRSGHLSEPSPLPDRGFGDDPLSGPALSVPPLPTAGGPSLALSRTGH